MTDDTITSTLDILEPTSANKNITADENRLIAFGGSIKALGDGRVSGYLVKFTDADNPDLQGEYFDSGTDFDLEPGDRATVYYQHGLDPTMGTQKIGTGNMRQDDIGVWIDAQLDMRDEYVRYIYAMAEANKSDWSSGSLPNLVTREPVGKSHWIKTWPIGKDATISPTPAAGLNQTSVITLKAYKQMAETNPEFKALLPEAGQETRSADADDGAGDADVSDSLDNLESAIMADEKEVEDEAVKAVTLEQIGEVINSAVKPLGERLEKLEAKPVNEIKPVKAVNVVTDTEHWKYDNLDAGDLAFMIGTLDAAKRDGRSRRGPQAAAYKALGVRLDSEESRKSESLTVARGAMKSAGIKANEINQSTLASYGDEWVGVAYSGQLWESIRHATFVLPKLPSMEVPAGAESVVIPLESTDPTWYKVAQAASLSANPGGVPTNTVTASNLGTANNTLTLGKMGARVLWTGELEEDSVLPYVAQLRQQLAVSAGEYLEHVLIDGDTATGATTNINDIGGTPAGAEAFLILNGFRKSPLVTTTANSRDGGALTVEDYLETVKLMGLGGKNAIDRRQVGFIIDPYTHWKSLELDEVKTQDVYSAPTIEDGQLMNIWGYEVMQSVHMHKANADATYGLKANSAGKLDLDTASNNTTGVILAVRWDQWQFGWRRRMTIETTRVPAADSTEIVALMRFGMVQRDTEASAISYNLTI